MLHTLHISSWLHTTDLLNEQVWNVLCYVFRSSSSPFPLAFFGLDAHIAQSIYIYHTNERMSATEKKVASMKTNPNELAFAHEKLFARTNNVIPGRCWKKLEFACNSNKVHMEMYICCIWNASPVACSVSLCHQKKRKVVGKKETRKLWINEETGNIQSIEKWIYCKLRKDLSWFALHQFRASNKLHSTSDIDDKFLICKFIRNAYAL